MAQFVKLRDKGQITLPLGIRNQLGLQQDHLLETSIDNGRIVLELVVRNSKRPVLIPIHLLEGLVGIATLGGDAVKDSASYEQ